MTTETKVMAILERANPVPPGELVDVPVGATRYFETAQQQRSEPMTVIDPTPTQGAGQPPRRRWPLIAVAASVVALIVASVALVVAARDDAAVVDQPEPTVPPTIAETVPEADEPAPTTTTAAPDSVGAQAAVDEFFAAYNAGDTDSVLALFADGAAVTDQYGSPVPAPSAESIDLPSVENGLAWNHAQGEMWIAPECELAAAQLPSGTTLSCRWDTLDAVVQAVDGEPIPTNALIVVADGAVVGLHRAFTRPDFSTLGVPFQMWMETSHPEVEGADCCSGDTREESEQRGALRAEWAQAWAAWLNEWNCDLTSCTIPAERWVAEYDGQCTRPGELFNVPSTALRDHMKRVPSPSDVDTAANTLLAIDSSLASGLQQPGSGGEMLDQRAELMVELGIDEACWPGATDG